MARNAFRLTLDEFDHLQLYRQGFSFNEIGLILSGKPNRSPALSVALEKERASAELQCVLDKVGGRTSLRRARSHAYGHGGDQDPAS